MVVLSLNYIGRLSGAALISFRDLSACDERVLAVSTTALPSLPFHITVPVGTYVNTHGQHRTHWLSWPTCSKGLKRLLLLHCGSVPLGGSGCVIDEESPSEIVLPLLPACWQSRQLLVLPGTRHVLVQKRPFRLQNTKNSQRLYKWSKK